MTNNLDIDGMQITIADDYVVEPDEERWVGEYYFFPSGVCIQIFQEPVHGYFVKIERRRLIEFCN